MYPEFYDGLVDVKNPAYQIDVATAFGTEDYDDEEFAEIRKIIKRMYIVASFAVSIIFVVGFAVIVL